MIPAENSAEFRRRFFINAVEHKALCEMVGDGYPYAALIYLLEMRPNMDFSTGIVGETRRLSEKGLRELLERRPKQGSHHGFKSRSRQWFQRQISALEKYWPISDTESAPLIQKIPDKRMCYRLVLADKGLIRLGEERAEERAKGRAGERAKKGTVSPLFERDVANMTGQMIGRNGADERAEERTTSVSFTTTTESGVFTMEQLLAVDSQMVVNIYHELFPNLPRVKAPSVDGIRLAVARIWYLRADDEHHKPEFWRFYFGECAKSDFLMGRVVLNQSRGRFKPNFLALVTPDVFGRLLNGGYT